MFSSFIGKNSTAEKARLLLAYSDFYITFASDLTSFSVRRESQSGKNLIPTKIEYFFSSSLLSLVYTYSAFSVTFKRSCITINGNRLAKHRYYSHLHLFTIF